MAAIIAAVSILAIAFMALFFVKICTESIHVTVFEVFSLDTESCVLSGVAHQRVVSEPQEASTGPGCVASNVLVMPESRTSDRIRHTGGRKHA